MVSSCFSSLALHVPGVVFTLSVTSHPSVFSVVLRQLVDVIILGSIRTGTMVNRFVARDLKCMS